MELRELVRALLEYDTISARQWVADFARAGAKWCEIPNPEGFSREELAVAAGIVEMLATRCGEPFPRWTENVPASPRRIFLVRAADTMHRLRRACEAEGPEPLRRRQLFAPPDFLTVA